MLDLDVDPKLAWALRHRDRFPVDLNRAPREMLLRVPGLGGRRRWTGCSRPGATAPSAARTWRGCGCHWRNCCPSWSPPTTGRMAGCWTAPTCAGSSRRAPASPRWPGRCNWPCYERKHRHPAARPGRFRRLAATGAAAVGGWCAARARRVGGRRRQPRPVCRRAAAHRMQLPLSPASHVPSWSSPRSPSATATGNASRCSTACCGGWRRASPGCCRWRPTPTSSGCRAWSNRYGGTRISCTPSCASAASRPRRGERYVAWFEPDHHILEAETGFFIRRFAALRWSILTPEASAHWDGETLRMGPGGSRAEAPPDDAHEELWRAYYRASSTPRA